MKDKDSIIRLVLIAITFAAIAGVASEIIGSMWQGLFATTCIFGFWALQRIYNATHFKELLELHQAESQEEIDDLLQKIEKLEEVVEEKKRVQEKQDRLIAELNLAVATYKEKFSSLQNSYDTLKGQHDTLISYFKAQKKEKEPMPLPIK